ncbi:hypothetical protein M8009_02405 [Halomonas sp. ATCH28]|uniref:Uncharacterized protein n=1 Tax=Halomonas gemina TaxID=2945105 RepID=A0ABT0SX59_9GAMM|nr:hypothetical protein [Halomonas gemina]MCL7939158.1 hypothetical protein [Halomonas gemina]
MDRVENPGIPGIQMPTEPTEPGFVSSVGTPTAAYPEIEVPPKPSPSRHDWLEWVAAQVPLIPDDRRYVWSRLATMPPQAMEKAARRYVQTWTDVAGDEPKPHRKDNAGRRAANRTLLALIRPGSWRWRHEHRKP